MAEVHILEDAPVARALYRTLERGLSERQKELLDMLLKSAWLEGCSHGNNRRPIPEGTGVLKVGA